MSAPHGRGPSIPAAVVRALILTGEAEPLVADHFPVPVLFAGHWWHLPMTEPTPTEPGTTEPGTTGVDGAVAVEGCLAFVRAPTELAAQLQAHATRAHAAASAVRSTRP